MALSPASMWLSPAMSISIAGSLVSDNVAASSSSKRCLVTGCDSARFSSPTSQGDCSSGRTSEEIFVNGAFADCGEVQAYLCKA